MATGTIETADPACASASGFATVLFFGRLADAFGRSATLAIPRRGCRVSDLKARLAGRGAEAVLGEPSIRVAVDQVMAAGDPWVSPGQEVAFLPAFSGG